jgi:hypothetical protein
MAARPHGLQAPVPLDMAHLLLRSSREVRPILSFAPTIVLEANDP